MISIYERYVPSLQCPQGDLDASIVFVADGDQLLVRTEEEDVVFPGLGDFGPALLGNDELDYLGSIDGCHCFCIPYEPAISIPEGMSFRSLRANLDFMREHIGLVAARALHIADWSRKNKFCGRCGGRTRRETQERARKCPSCGNLLFPKISPAIIIAIKKGDQLLLVQNRALREKWYTVIAGFVEPGETIEDCARREAFEEVGIRIKNIRYFASQPWPFPDSLMLALTAEYESGELRPDGMEILDAGFFGADELPKTPSKATVAGRLVEWFLNSVK